MVNNQKIDDPFVEDFFAPLENTKPYLKLAFEGEPGTGKSMTAAMVAIGLHKQIKSTKPIVIFDTEKAAKFLIPLFNDAGVKAVVKESHSLADLRKAMELCVKGYSDILLLDSITHIWLDFQEAYKRKLNRTKFRLNDWGQIKSDWNANLSVPLVQLPLHMIVTGRVSDRMEEEEVDGEQKLTKVGVKMQTEKNTAYEFDMIALMERHEKINAKKREVWRQATILKGRGGLMDGAVIKNPTYKDFEKAIDSILANGVQRTQVEMDAAAIIQTEDNKREWMKRKDIALEKVEAYFTKVWPGSSADVKATRVKASEYAFGTPSWTAIAALTPDALEAGYPKLHEYAELTLGADLTKEREQIVPNKPE